jgi:phosphate transport system substrate-binding protein
MSIRHLLPATLALLGGFAPAAETLSARTSQSVAPLIEVAKPALEKLHPGIKVTVNGVPTPASIKAVAAGEVQVGGIVRELKPDEKTANPDLITIPIARDGLALVVNGKNPVSNLTKDQARDLLTGVVSSWKPLGGDDAPIQIIGRVESNALNEMLEQKFGMEHQVEGEGKDSTMSFKTKGTGAFTVKFPVTGTHKDALAQVLVKPGAFSFIPLALASESLAKGQPVKILALDGVAPNAESINGGTYFLSRTLYLLTKGEPTGVVKDLRDHLLSAEGQALVAAKGCVPIK